MRMEIACTLAARLRGLVGKDANTALLLVPCNDVHTFTMDRPIDVAFVGRDGTIVAAYRRVEPRRRLRDGRAVATLERYATEEAWYERGDRVDVRGASPRCCDRARLTQPNVKT